PLGPVVLEGKYACIGEGSNLTVLDVSDPSDPQLVSRKLLPGSLRGLVISDSLAYVFDDSSQLFIVDISVPATPEIVSTYALPSNATGVAVSGSLVYVADGSSGLRILDVTDPAAAAEVGSYESGSQSLGVAVSGSLAYLADDIAGLEILDVSDPSTPLVAGVYDAGYPALSVVLTESIAFVVFDTSQDQTPDTRRLDLLDLTDAASPQLLSSYSSAHGIRSVTVSGDRVYIQNAGVTAGIFDILDIADPRNPALLGSYSSSDAANGLAASGSVVYVTDEGGRFRIVDVSNPSEPNEQGGYATPRNATDIALVGSLAYVANRSGLVVVDISNLSLPTLVNTPQIPVSLPDAPMTVAVSGSVAGVAGVGSGLHLFDISDPAAPSFVSSYTGVTGARDVAIVDAVAFVANDEGLLHILDISIPNAPSVLNIFGTAGQAFGVAISGSLAYIAEGSSGLQIVDVSAPDSPEPGGTLALPGNSVGVAVEGSFAYVAAFSQGLQIVDVSDPASPSLKGSYTAANGVVGVAAAAPLAFLADLGSGLKVVDVSNPQSPVLRGGLDTPGLSRNVAVRGKTIFLAAEDGGFQILQLQSPLLSDGRVDPVEGSPATEFSWFVKYFSADGKTPATSKVFIDGTSNTMTLSSGTAANGTYRYGPRTLSAGAHTFYFSFEETLGGAARLPETGSLSGPVVATGSVQGIVLDAVSDAAVEDATVSLVNCEGTTTVLAAALTDANGAFTISNVADGDYYLTVEREGYISTRDPLAGCFHVPVGGTEDRGTISLQSLPSSHPVIGPLPNIVVGDQEDFDAEMDNNFFRFDQAFNFLDYVSDPDTSPTAILWSFMEADTTDAITINTKHQLADGDNPRAPGAKELTGGGANFLADIRLISLSPEDQSLPFADVGTSGSTVLNRPVTFFATDGANVTSKTITVRGIENGFDRLVAPPQVVYETTFDTSPGNWSPIIFDSSAQPLAFRGASTSFTDGRLVLTSPNNSSNYFGQWEGEANIPYVPNKVYRALWEVSTDQATASAVPSGRFRLSPTQPNVCADGYQVNAGGTNTNVPPLSPATRVYAQYFEPVDLSSLQADSSSAGLSAYFDIIDFGPTISGSLFLDSVTVETLDPPELLTNDISITSFIANQWFV
ncbi:MAG: carboxypeptidase regulatory-like domain-containing protein, partial [bacterium]